MRMGCPRCGSFYEADAKFCARDGAALVVAAGPPVIPGIGAAARRHSGHKPPAPPPKPGVIPPRGSPAAGSTPTEGARWLDYASLAGSMLDGRYLVVSKIADGGMSVVYLGQDHENAGQRVAIKFLPPELSEDLKAMERLRREADMGIRLVHRNVCSIIRIGETSDGLVYVVMPFIEGEVLCDRTYRLGSIPLALAVKLVNDMAAGLHAAHELDIIHRDLKPENVMICAEPSGDEYAVVMDFGLAKDREAARFLEKLTATGVVLGTPEFMSPEQLRGKPLDRRTDIYSLALVTYEMLTGRLPFPGENQQDLLLARLRSHPTPIREMRPDLGFSSELEKVLTRALQRVPDDRYATAPEFAAALSAATSGGGLLSKLLK
jgi:serine/threonine protein kinase